MAICVGPAGTGGDLEGGLLEISKAKLDAVEIPFTYSVWMKSEVAAQVKEMNSKLQLQMSIHGSYFINLASLLPMSRKRACGSLKPTNCYKRK